MTGDERHDGMAEEQMPYRLDASADEVNMIDLSPVDAKVGLVQFLAAERIGRSPLVRIHYALAGKRQHLAHRLDLDKRIFLDDLEAGGLDDMRAAAAKISAYLAKH